MSPEFQTRISKAEINPQLDRNATPPPAPTNGDEDVLIKLELAIHKIILPHITRDEERRMEELAEYNDRIISLRAFEESHAVLGHRLA